jgi:hypothetical protein
MYCNRDPIFGIPSITLEKKKTWNFFLSFVTKKNLIKKTTLKTKTQYIFIECLCHKGNQLFVTIKIESLLIVIPFSLIPMLFDVADDSFY